MTSFGKQPMHARVDSCLEQLLVAQHSWVKVCNIKKICYPEHQVYYIKQVQRLLDPGTRADFQKHTLGQGRVIEGGE